MHKQKFKLLKLPLSCLTITKGQTRKKGIQADVDALVESIRMNGLLEPIIVCESEDDGKYEIKDGQQRVLAVKSIGWKTIPALLIKQKDAATYGKTWKISIWESEKFKKLTNKEMGKRPRPTGGQGTGNPIGAIAGRARGKRSVPATTGEGIKLSFPSS